MTKHKGRDSGNEASRKAGASGAAKVRRADGAVEKAIGNRLRAYYEEIAREPVPDRFVELLKQLDERDPGKG